MWSIIQFLFGYFFRLFFNNRNCDNHQLPTNDDSININSSSNDGNNVDTSSDSEDVINNIDKDSKESYSVSSHHRTVTTYASPGLMTLIDTALYRAHEGQLTATISSASATLVAFLQLKLHAKRLLHTCYTLPPPPSLQQYQCINNQSVPSSSPTITSSNSNNNSKSTKHNNSNNPVLQYNNQKRLHLENISTLTSFAKFCIESSNEAIQSITTDNLSKSANLDPIISPPDDYNQNDDDYDDDEDDYDHDLYDSDNDVVVVVASSTSAATTTATTSTKFTTPLNGAISPSGTSLSSNRIMSPTQSSEAYHETKKYYVERGVSSSKFNYWNEVGLRCPTTTTSSSTSTSGRSTTSTTKNDNPYSNSLSQHNIRKNDIWESEKLYCLDYVWADHSMNHCQRMVRSITKHDSMELMIDFLTQCEQSSRHIVPNDNNDVINDDNNIEMILPFLQDYKIRHDMMLVMSNILTLLHHDLPLRLHQFRCGIERNTPVSKRLYLIKNECRAPFRAFLEGHDHVQRAPDLSLVNDYIALHDKNNTKQHHGNSGSSNAELIEKKKLTERKIQDFINDPRLKEALMTEYKCEMLEVDMGMILFPFCNLARVLLDGKGVFHLVEVPGVLPEEDVLNLQELLRRLKSILCKKAGVDTSTGIRPLLQDIQGVPRDPSPSSIEIHLFGQYDCKRVSVEEAIDKRLERLCAQLQCLHELSKIKGGFGIDKRDFDGLASSLKACSVEVDTDAFCAKFKEWYSLCKSQKELTEQKPDNNHAKVEKNDMDNSSSTTETTIKTHDQLSFDNLVEGMRKAEIEVSIAIASRQALSVVQQRIGQIEQDRLKRFEILQEMLKEVCVREMDFHLDLKIPEKDYTLELPKIDTVSGIFDPVLEMFEEI